VIKENVIEPELRREMLEKDLTISTQRSQIMSRIERSKLIFSLLIPRHAEIMRAKQAKHDAMKQQQ